MCSQLLAYRRDRWAARNIRVRSERTTGGFTLDILSRDQGDVSPRALQVVGRCCGERLVVTVSDGTGEVFRKETVR